MFLLRCTRHRELVMRRPAAFGKEIDWWAAMDRDVDPLAIARTLWEESQAKDHSYGRKRKGANL